MNANPPYHNPQSRQSMPGLIIHCSTKVALLPYRIVQLQAPLVLITSPESAGAVAVVPGTPVFLTRRMLVRAGMGALSV